MVTDSKSTTGPTPREETGKKHPRCGAITKKGESCAGRPSKSGFCLAHDPALASTRESARVRGGENSSSRARLEKLMPERLRPTFELLEKAVNEVYEGRLPPQRASAMASLTGAMVKVINAGKADGNFSLPTQLDFPGLDAWYKMIRNYRRITPRLRGETEGETRLAKDDDEMLNALERFGNKYGTIQLPKESM